MKLTNEHLKYLPTKKRNMMYRDVHMTNNVLKVLMHENCEGT
jgi:hypothetical protein